MNRRAFILSVFGGVAALEMGTAADLAIPDRMPLSDPVPDPAKWWNPYSYGFLAEMRSSEWCVQSLNIAKNFYVREIAWYASNGAEAKLYQDDQLLCRAHIRPVQVSRMPVMVPVFMPAGTSFVLKMRNAPANYLGNAMLAIHGLQELTLEELAVLRSGMVDAEFEDEQEEAE